LTYKAPAIAVPVRPERMAEFIAQELRKVEQAFATLRGFGSLTLGPLPPTPIVVNLTTTMAKLQIFAGIAASGTFVDVVPLPNPDARLQVRRTGIYWWGFDLEAEIPTGRDIEFEIFINGQPTGITARVDASNQTNVLTYSAFGIVKSVANGYGEVWGRFASGANDSITVTRAQFLMHRIGD
jgi:hypothetical protein